jgi:hypothetical protein
LVLSAASILGDMNPRVNVQFEEVALSHSSRVPALAVVTGCQNQSSERILRIVDMTAFIDKLTFGRFTIGTRGYASLTGRPPRKLMRGGCISKRCSC